MIEPPASPPKSIAQRRGFAPLFDAKKGDDKSSYAHRILIGVLGLLLPWILLVLDRMRPTLALTPWHIGDSVSDYYYTGGVAAFVGILIALAVFFFTYRGYGNKSRRWDIITAWIAGISAVCAHTGVIHHLAATLLFLCFIWFSLVLFRIPAESTAPADPKREGREIVYVFCGVGMSFCLAWAVLARAANQSLFVPEALALELFAFSWLVKGRAGIAGRNLGIRIGHYVTHPRDLKEDFRELMSP